MAKAPRPHIESAPEVQEEKTTVETAKPVEEKPVEEKPVAAEAPSAQPKAAPKPKAAKAAPAAPRPTVSVDATAAEQPAQPKASAKAEPQGAQAASDVAENDAPQSKGWRKALSTPSEWLSRTFPGHEHAALGGIIGVFVALCIFVLGFLKTFFISMLMVVGIAIGQYLDGDPKIINHVRQLITELRGNE